MVDLVKIRRKAKEKKNAESEAEVSLRSGPLAESLPVEEPLTNVDASPVGTRSSASGTVVGGGLAPNPTHEGAGRAAERPYDASTGIAESAKLRAFKETAGRRRESAVVDAEDPRKGGEDQPLELLLFTLAGEEYAIGIENIIEIIDPREPTRVPNADPTIVGIISLRGTIVTILDLRRKLRHPPAGPESDADGKIVVIDLGGEIAGFLVDRVWRKITIDRTELGSHPTVSADEQQEYIGGVFLHDSRLSILLEIDRLFAH